MTKSELITKIVAAGRAADLRAIMEGESSYTDESSDGAPRDQVLGRLWTIALYHLEFVAEFGNRSEGLMKNGKWLSPFPKEFSEWLDAGSPGISANDLEKYLHDNPI